MRCRARPVLAACWSALALGAAFAAPADATRRGSREILEAMERLARAQAELAPLEARGVERELESAARELRALGKEATPLLGWYVAARERPLKVRVYAAAALGLIGDPLAFGALKARVRDSAEDPGLRSAALQACASLGLAPQALRPLLEEVLRADAPDALRREALAQLAWLGSDETALLEAAARLKGPRPEGLDRGSAAHAMAALGRGQAPDGLRALFRLLGYFQTGHPLRGAALSALTRRLLIATPLALRRKAPLPAEDLQAVTGVLFEESGEAARLAGRLLGGLEDARATDALIRALAVARDPAVLADVAQTLAAIGDPSCVAALTRLADGLIRDERFQVRAGEADPREYALSIQRAAESVRAPRAAAGKEAPAGAAAGFRYEGWPGAGRPKLAWNGAAVSLALRERPERTAGILNAPEPAIGEPIAFDGSLVVTLRPGRARARADITLEARVLGSTESLTEKAYMDGSQRRKLSLGEGDTIELLSYRAEGLCFLRRGGEVLEAPCPQNDRANFTMLEEPDTEWWLHAEFGGRSGWFPAEQAGIDFLPREF